MTAENQKRFLDDLADSVVLRPGAVYRVPTHGLASISGALIPGTFRLYGVCFSCRKMVRLDKPILGALHYCAGEGLINMRPRWK